MPGLSETAHELADVYVQIPMVGFTQSFNISVTVALSLYALTQKIRTSPLEWGLSAAERRDLELIWLQRSLKHGDRVARHFLKSAATPNLKGLADR
jgi:tRNA (guanosine-2'-O-)-methyltransferase